MLNLEHVYDFFKSRIKDIGLSCVSDETIAMPNDPFDPEGKPFWIELSMAPVGAGPLSENTRQHAYIFVITCCVQAGAGTEHISNVSGRIADLFDPRSPNSGSYSMIPAGYLYVRGLDKMPGYAEDSVYKMSIRVTIELVEI